MISLVRANSCDASCVSQACTRNIVASCPPLYTQEPQAFANFLVTVVSVCFSNSFGFWRPGLTL